MRPGISTAASTGLNMSVCVCVGGDYVSFFRSAEEEVPHLSLVWLLSVRMLSLEFPVFSKVTLALSVKGTYFARDAAYSSRFCKDDIKHGNTFQIHGVSLQQRHLFRTYKSMFLARVLIGDYINGDSKYMRPPSKDGSYVNLYDSCVDDTWNPKIFVVFDANQIYPEYLIDFH